MQVGTGLVLICCLFVSCVVTSETDEYQLIEEVLSGVDHYKVLDVSPDATEKEIKKSFHKLSMVYHPDKIKKEDQTEETHTLFLSIARAYSVLSTKQSREYYDHLRTHGVPWEKRYYGRWAHYYGAPSHNLSTVVIAVSVIFTTIHFILKWNRYNRVVAYVKTKDIYKQRAKKVRAEQNLSESDEVDVEFTGLKKPTWKDLLPIAILIGLWKFFSYWTWYIVWIKILRKPYDAEAEMLKKLNMTKEEYEIAKEKYLEKVKRMKTSAKAKKYRRLKRKYESGRI